MGDYTRLFLHYRRDRGVVLILVFPLAFLRERGLLVLDLVLRLELGLLLLRPMQRC
jgi:hypothetical protein